MMLITLHADRPLYLQIFESIRDAIDSGELAEGARLPSSRALADELGVSRNVVLLAYDNLYAEGFIRAKEGSGTFVEPINDRLDKPIPLAVKTPPRPAILSSYGERLANESTSAPFWVATPLDASSPRFDFRYGHPPMDLFPFGTWRRLLRENLANRNLGHWGYGAPEGLASLRSATADYLTRSRNVVCAAKNMIIVNGSQQGIDLVARLLLDPGDCAVVEEPCYPGTRAVLHALGAQIIPVPVDEEGIDVRRLNELSQRVRLAVVTPSHHYPTGCIMSLSRRLALAEWADRTGSYILEDDYDSEFRYGSRPVASLQGLYPNGPILYLGTFSKVLVPALRIGYLVVPDNLVGSFVAAKAVADRHTATLAQLALTDFIVQGHFEHHLRRARVQNEVRRGVLIDALRENLGVGLEVSGAAAGVHLLAWLRGITARQLDARLEEAASEGVIAYSVRDCYTRPVDRAGLVLGYASLPEQDIRAGIAILSTILRRR